MSTKDVNLQFIVARFLDEASKRKENENTKNATLLNEVHKANESFAFIARNPDTLRGII